MRCEREKLYLADTPSDAFDVKACDENDIEYESLRSRLECENKRGKFFGVLAKNLYDISFGKVDALELIFETPLIKDYYRELYQYTNGCPRLLPSSTSIPTNTLI